MDNKNNCITKLDKYLTESDLLDKKNYINEDYATLQQLNTEARIRSENDAMIVKNLTMVMDEYSRNKIIIEGKIGVLDTKLTNNNQLATVNKDYAGAINEIKSVNDTQNTNIIKNTNDILGIKNDSLTVSDFNSKLALKQDKTDSNLLTTSKSAVGAINEIKVIADSQDIIINKNTMDIIEQATLISNLQASSGSVTTDITALKDLKQDKTDNALVTTSKSVVDAINEVKTMTDGQSTIISNNTTDITDLKDSKQDKTDNALVTTSKTIVTAINEVKTMTDSQVELTNKNTTDIAGQAALISNLQASSGSVTTDITALKDLKQDKTDNALVTTSKSVVDAINEVKTMTDSQVALTSKNTNDIVNIKTSYLTVTAANSNLALKQDKTDNALVTTSKSVVGAINEVKTMTDSQVELTNKNTTDIAGQAALISNLQASSGSVTTDITALKDSKQDKTDNALVTTSKSVVGAINEVKSTTDSQVELTNKNTTDIAGQAALISNLQASSGSVTTDITALKDSKQDKTDNALVTTSKSVVGAINEVKSTTDSQVELTNKNTTDIAGQAALISNLQASSGSVTTDITDLKDSKQDKTDNALVTTSKSVVGAINEVKSTTDSQVELTNKNTTDIAGQAALISNLQASSGSVTTDITDLKYSKQDKTDNALVTTSKSVVGAINEVKSTTDSQVALTSKNTNDIVNIKTSYLTVTAANSNLALKQDKTDNALVTTSKSVVDAINEVKTMTDGQSTIISNNTTDITDLKDSKQDKTDNALVTTSKSVVGAINEVKSTTDSQVALTSKNTNDIVNIKTSYLTVTAANSNLALKQDKTDNALVTTSKSVVGAINEVKTMTDGQSTIISNNTTDITVLKNSKQDKTDNNLNTTSKSVVGAINEVKSTTDSQVALTSKNTNDIVNIKTSYLTVTAANSNLALKQDKTDNALVTTSKSVVDAINEVKTMTDSQVALTSKNTNDIVNIKTSYLTVTAANSNLALKQDKTDNALVTTSKSVVGAINEVKTMTDSQVELTNKNTTDIAGQAALISNLQASSGSVTTDITALKDSKQDKTDNALVTTSKSVVGAINEVKSTTDSQVELTNKNTTDIAGQAALISNLQASSGSVTTDITALKDSKQDKTDNALVTTSKSVVGAINEVKSTTDSQVELTNKNTTDIAGQAALISNLQASSGSVTTDITDLKDSKQDKTDNALVTTSKSVVGAINEVKSTTDSQVELTNKNTTDIAGQAALISNLQASSGSVTTDITDLKYSKQDKTDNALVTTSKSVVGAINEVKSTTDSQVALTSKNTNDIVNIKTSYLTVTAANSNLALKQDKTDNALVTTSKSVVGAINEVKTMTDSQVELTNKNTTDIAGQAALISNLQASSGSVTTDITDLKDSKQDKTDNALVTTSKSVVGAINEVKTMTDGQSTIISNNTTDITDLKDSKQDKTDNALVTTSKSVVGAINEVKSTTDSQVALTSKNTNDIVNIKTSYLTVTAANSNLALKQDKTDNALVTTSKSVVDAINEVKTMTDGQSTIISNNTTDITDLKDSKQDKTDNALVTTSKSVVGAINEVKSTTDSQVALTSKNTNDIVNIKTSYLTVTAANSNLALKQDKTDNALVTTSKSVVGAINEVKTMTDGQSTIISNNTTDITVLKNSKQDKTDNNLNTTSKSVVGAINEVKSTTDSQVALTSKNTNDIVNIKTSYLTVTAANSNLALKQDKTDNALVTTSKTIVTAINEVSNLVTTQTQNWQVKGVSFSAKRWDYNLVTNKRYRVSFNWSTNTDASIIYKEFIFKGTTIELETFIEGFSGVTLLGITVLGSANICELLATSVGVSIVNKMGIISLGRVVNLEELQ